MASPPRQMRIQSVRFSEGLWSEIQEEARLQGVSGSQFIREASIVQLAWSRAERDGTRDRSELYRLVHDLLADA